MTVRLPIAIVVTSIVGAAVFCAFMPWGDPCSVGHLSQRLCLDVASHRQIANAVFVAICIFVGFAAGTMAETYRYVAGAVSVPLSAMLGGMVGHHVYAMHGPWLHWDDRGAYRVAALFLAFLAVLGLVGASASRMTNSKRWRRA